VVLIPLLLVGLHLLCAYWLCKYTPLRYALPLLVGLTLLVSLVWYGLAWVFAFGLGEAMVLPEHRPLEWFRPEVQFQQVILGPFNGGLLPLPLGLFLLGVGSLFLARLKGGWLVLVVGFLLLSSGAAVYANQPLRLSDVVAQARDVPLYPGATAVRLETAPWGQWCTVSFRTSASPDQVLAFYQGVGQQLGWVRDEPHKGLADLLLVFPTSTGMTPRNQVVSVVVANAGEEVAVVLGFDRWVNIRRLPLFSAAQDVHLTEQPDGTGGLESLTAFTSSSTPAAIITYYRTLAEQAGWWVSSEPVALDDGLQLRLTAFAGPATSIRVEATPNVEVLITAKPQPHRPTTVTLHARGPDLP